MTEMFLKFLITFVSIYLILLLVLTEVAGEGGTDCPPQKFLSSQKFRHLMSTTISQSFVKIGSKTKNFYY